jgi:DNA-binding MarR family transcriptional regulator
VLGPVGEQQRCLRARGGWRSPQELEQLGRELAATATDMVRWVPTEGIQLSLAAARVMARLMDNGPTRISDIATLEHSSQPTMTNHVKRLERVELVPR